MRLSEAGDAGSYGIPGIGRPGPTLYPRPKGRGERGWGAKGTPKANGPMPCCQETADRARYCREFVPQSDTGRQAEYAQARDRTLAKELGKMAP